MKEASGAPVWSVLLCPPPPGWREQGLSLVGACARGSGYSPARRTSDVYTYVLTVCTCVHSVPNRTCCTVHTCCTYIRADGVRLRACTVPATRTATETTPREGHLGIQPASNAGCARVNARQPTTRGEHWESAPWPPPPPPTAPQSRCSWSLGPQRTGRAVCRAPPQNASSHVHCIALFAQKK